MACGHEMDDPLKMMVVCYSAQMKIGRWLADPNLYIDMAQHWVVKSTPWFHELSTATETGADKDGYMCWNGTMSWK